jgi:hypothetical protein
MSLLVELAEAVVAALNHAELAVHAQRHYRPVYDLAQLRELKVSVVPRSITIAGISRGVNQFDAAVDVAIQKKIAADSELDGLMNRAEQVSDLFRLKRLAAMPSALWLKTENSPIYSPEHLEQHRVFTSVLTLSFRVIR